MRNLKIFRKESKKIVGTVTAVTGSTYTVLGDDGTVYTADSVRNFGIDSRVLVFDGIILGPAGNKNNHQEILV